MPRWTQTPEQRFLSRVDARGGCLVWTGALNPKGYGSGFKVDGRSARPHRWAYERWCGPIPDGLVIDHLCETKACVYVGHLEAVTSQENTRRGVERRGDMCRRGHDLSLPGAVYWFDQEKGGTVYRGRQCLECAKITAAARTSR